jgi:DNA polymerase-3 subunit epsilon
MANRQIVLDTETTGLEHRQGHRIIEIGCVEMIERKFTGNNFHVYLNPERLIDDAAIEVHGITNEFLENKPHFEDIAQQFVEYMSGAELVIHNAAFDVGFIDSELARLEQEMPKVESICSVHDTLLQARKMFPGQRNDLDSLCKRYFVSNDHRELHGALLDAEILAEVYLAMTGGQTSLSLDNQSAEQGGASKSQLSKVDLSGLNLAVIDANDEESEKHAAWVEKLNKAVDGDCVWQKLNQRTNIH